MVRFFHLELKRTTHIRYFDFSELSFENDGESESAAPKSTSTLKVSTPKSSKFVHKRDFGTGKC